MLCSLLHIPLWWFAYRGFAVKTYVSNNYPDDLPCSVKTAPLQKDFEANDGNVDFATDQMKCRGILARYDLQRPLKQEGKYQLLIHDKHHNYYVSSIIPLFKNCLLLNPLV